MRKASSVLVLLVAGAVVSARAAPPVRLVTLDPGHFHAGLIQKEMYPGVDPTVHVYAPFGPDLLAHLGRVSAFNARAERPTTWRLEVHAGPDFMERMLREKPGNVVVLSGRNRGKMDRIEACVNAGLNVLADKPWLIESADFPKLERALQAAEKKGLVAYDVMTERYEITTILQRELSADRDLAGTVGPGTEASPAIEMESVHHILKTVAGAPNLRPAWFFDTAEQGEALSDVATHLVDLVPFVLFPGQPVDYRADVRVLAARRWSTGLGKDQLLRVTGGKELPAGLAARMKDGTLDYLANGEVTWTVKGVHAKAKVLWNYEAPAGGGDTHVAVVRGRRARVEIRQGAEEKWRPEVYVVPNREEDATSIEVALGRRVAALAQEHPGLAVERAGAGFRVVVPDVYRVGHEAHFGEVTRRFLDYLKAPASVPRWETANMLAKYYVTTRAVELSREP